MSKMMGGGKAARNSLGSSDIDGNNGNKYGNGTKIARHSLEGSNKKVVKSRRKSSLTPFAQRLLGTKWKKGHMHKKEDIIYPPRENKSEQSKRLDISIFSWCLFECAFSIID